jgi:ribose/xylose/arabinose/galactoside ABC-type transport system permease subunit
MIKQRLRKYIYSLSNPGRHSSQRIWVLLVLLLIPILIVVPEFFRSRNLANILIQMVPLGILAIGQTYVILGAGIDLSVGAQVSLITLISSTLMSDSPVVIIFVVLLCLGLGIIFGFLNGGILKFFPIPPLIVTLCTGFLFQGLAFAIHKTSGGYIPRAFSKIMTASRGLISFPFTLFILLFILFNVILTRARFGRYVYALGGNSNVLENTGIQSHNVRIKTYIISGFLCAVVGLYIAARLKSGSSHYGEEYTLLSITATVAGGTSLMGGVGGLSGTLAGTILVSMLNNVLNNIAFRFNLQSSFYRSIIVGLILLIAMLSYRKRD